MGAKAWFIAYFDDDPTSVLAGQPKLDVDASRKLAQELFPGFTFENEKSGTLGFLNPRDHQVFVGSYGGLRIVAHKELANDYPSQIDPRWLHPSLGRTAYLHATHSVVDFLAFGLWRDGQLIRALSISPDNGIQEQIGAPLAFESPYWEGQKAVEVDADEEPYPLPFHPLDLSEASMLQHLGFQFEGHIENWVCDPDTIPITTYSVAKRRRSWKFW
jgi:hypothetical protein